MSRVNNSRKPCCKVCKDSGKSERDYSSHWPKDNSGNTICPTLLAQKCRYCGDNGHTVKYCKVLTTRNRSEDVVSKFENREKRIVEYNRDSKKIANTNNVAGRFDILMDQDSDADSPRTQKKAPVLECDKDEFPNLSNTLCTSIQIEHMSFVDALIKQVPLKRTEDTIISGMVSFKRTSKEMTEREKMAEIRRQDCFKGLNGLGWADMDSDDEYDVELY